MTRRGVSSWIPEHIGSYEILEDLSSGGMGAVVLGRKRGPGGFEQLAAIKVIRQELRATDSLRSMFFDEAQLLAKISHPAIATIFDFGEADGTLYLAMEYVAGIRFRELIDKPPSPVIAARAMAAACRGLHSAHELADLNGTPMGVVHRDVSPENLMLTFDGQVKVIDFGIALVKGRQAPVTEIGTIKGKPPYLSPEQVRNDTLDRRTDIFSAAVVLHEMLTGEQLFDGDSLYAVARSIEHAEIAAPSTRAPAVPGELDRIVLRALARDRKDRYITAAALADDLDAFAALAGGESLTEFAKRELGGEYALHRKWLAARLGTAADRDDGPAIGRASGVMTAVPTAPPRRTPPIDGLEPVEPRIPTDSGDGGKPAEPAMVAAAAARAGGASKGTDTAHEIRQLTGAPSTKRNLLLLAVLAAGGLAFYLLYPPKKDVVATAPVNADAGVADAPPPAPTFPVPMSDGGPPIVAVSPVDAATAPDARRRPVRDPSLSTIDATTSRPPPRPDAGVAPASAFGYLSVAADPFALVKLDGRDLGATPIIRAKVAVGQHEVILYSPDSGAERERRTITILDGKTQSIVIR